MRNSISLSAYALSDIAGFELRFATLNYFVCDSKLNLASKFHTQVANSFPFLQNLRTFYCIINFL